MTDEDFDSLRTPPGTSSDGHTPQAPDAARHRTLDLIALVTLLAIATGVYLAAGSGGFEVITGAGVGLYGLWRARR
ncbi:hypothetical protein ACFV1W_14075 [Kitasatospora sp. NPDC059648]|uniref:hypothetical protein n=1 Tax=Kitasatospora sp. NPDC059648 TaxID=3346894 RepID=UPI0036C18F54